MAKNTKTDGVESFGIPNFRPHSSAVAAGDSLAAALDNANNAAQGVSGIVSLNPSSSADPKLFFDASHAAGCMTLLNEFRENGFLCDIEIKVEERLFSCHRSVLAASIPYFRSMFSCEMIESRQRQILIRDITAFAFDKLLNFAYTSKLDITPTNVQPLLYAASILQIDSVCSACEQFLTQYLTLQNCLEIRQFAQQHNCVHLLEAVDEFTAQNFQKLCDSPDFLQIPVSHLEDLFGRSDLYVSREEKVYETLIAWIKADPASRKSHFPTLLANVRLGQIPTQYLLEKVKKDPWVQDDVRCRDLVFEALEEHVIRKESSASTLGLTFVHSEGFKPAGLAAANASSARQSEDSSAAAKADVERKRPRKSAAGVIFCVGGRGTTGDPFRSVEAYNLRGNSWFQVTEMGVRRRHVGVVSAEGKLYAIGGHDGQDHLDSAECFDPLNNQWRPVASMETKRRGIAVGCLEGAIYAVGGLDDSTCFQTVERYDVEADRWSGVTPMNVQRGGVGVSALGRYLYAVGGNDGTSSLDSCERFDPHLNKWTLVAPMAHRRAGAGVTVLSGFLYTIGGFDDNAPLASCERYNPADNKWELLQPMSCPRGGVGVAAMGGRIYAVGGHDGNKYLDSVEAYDPVFEKWETVAQISQCRAGAGVAWCHCTVDCLQPASKAMSTVQFNSIS